MQTTPLPPRKPRLVYSIQQAAGELNVSERTVWRLIAAEKIKAIPISVGRRGIPASELMRVAEHGID